MKTTDRLAKLTADLLVPPPEPVDQSESHTDHAHVGDGEARTDGSERSAKVVKENPESAAAVAPSHPPLETRFPEALARPAGRRTGPGEMIAFRGQMLAAEGELQELRRRLKEHDGSLPTNKLDPKVVRPGGWANRHEASFQTAEFQRFKEEIEHAGGNIQPILVRPLPGQPGQYEIIFGHRRHRACDELGLPVLAVIWAGELADIEVFSLMDRENRQRTDLTAWEQGAHYKRALDQGLFASQRRMADHLGVSHTWIRKALSVAELPEAIVQCFKTPIEITFRHADQVNAALALDKKGVLRRAEKLRQSERVSASAVVAALIGKQRVVGKGARELTIDDKPVGRLRWDALGRAELKLEPGIVTEQNADAMVAAIMKVVASFR